MWIHLFYVLPNNQHDIYSDTIGNLIIMQPRKNKKNVEPKKTRNQKAKCLSHDGEEVNEGADKQSCSSSSIEGDCSSNPDGGQGQVPTALNSDGKTRATRGAATDPQSLYARVIFPLTTNFFIS